MESMALATVAALPAAFRSAAEAVVIRIEEFPSEDMLDSLDLEDSFELTGLYDGTPLTDKSVSDQAPQPDTIWLFRRAILGRVGRTRKCDARGTRRAYRDP